MTMINIRPKEYDLMLWRIVKEAAKGNFNTAIELAESLVTSEAVEFSTMRAGEKKMSSADTIERFVTYAQVISLLDPKLKPKKPPKDLDDIEGFQCWLGNKVLDYLNCNCSSPKEISKAINDLLEENPPRIPTIKNVYDKLQHPPPLVHFEISVEIISRLRPQVFKLQSKPVFIVKGTLEG